MQPVQSNRRPTWLSRVALYIKRPPLNELPLKGRHAGSLIVALGVGQIVSWGILTYAIAVLGTPMAEDMNVPRSVIFGAFSLALLTSGIVAPYSGSLIDRIGGRAVLLQGAALAGAALIMLGLSHSLSLFFLAWLLLGVAMSMSLYEAAFATLSQQLGTLRRAITAVTLFGGFASTVFIPACLYGLEHFGWRATVLAFGVIQLGVNVPLYTLAIPMHGGKVRLRPSIAPDTSSPHVADIRLRKKIILVLAVSFAAAAFVTSSIAAHVVNILQAKGLPIQTAVWIAALIGPMQVAGRLVELLAERRLGTVSAALAAFVLLAAATIVLGVAGGDVLLACAFVMMYGIANGVITIARGAVPAQLFGRVGYGATLGKIAAPSFVARSLAPFVVSFGLTRERSFGAIESLLLAAAAAALVMFVLAMRFARDHLGREP